MSVTDHVPSRLSDSRHCTEGGTGDHGDMRTRNLSGLLPALLLCAVGVTRFIFRSHYLYDIDSVGFALALKHFDPVVFQPHPPGYFLYVYLGRLFNTIISDANTALVAISIAASCGAAAMIYLLTRAWYGQRPAVISLLLFLVSPLCWFHGTVALTYIVEAFFSALVGYFCWLVYTGRTAFVIPASAALAVAAGFRPSGVLFLGPLWLASILRMDARRRALAIAAAGAGAAAWFVPMVLVSGGLTAYFGSLADLWMRVPGQRTTLDNPALAVARLVTIGWIFVMCFGAAGLAAFRRPSAARKACGDRKRFILIWLTPGLLFFTFVFLNYVNSGYLLVLCPPGFAFLADRLHQLLAARRGRFLRWAAVAVGAAANCAFFLFAPVYCSHRSVREFERNLEAVNERFLKAVNPQTTLIVGFDSHFLGYRHAGYYLPAFVTVQYPEVAYRDGKRVFLMKGAETQLVRRFAVHQFERVMLFPLPEGAEYAAYLNKLRAGLPQGALSAMKSGGGTVLTGPASVIPMLFPSTAGGTESVYTPERSPVNGSLH